MSIKVSTFGKMTREELVAYYSRLFPPSDTAPRSQTDDEYFSELDKEVSRFPIGLPRRR